MPILFVLGEGQLNFFFDRLQFLPSRRRIDLLRREPPTHGHPLIASIRYISENSVSDVMIDVVIFDRDISLRYRLFIVSGAGGDDCLPESFPSAS